MEMGISESFENIVYDFADESSLGQTLQYIEEVNSMGKTPPKLAVYGNSGRYDGEIYSTGYAGSLIKEASFYRRPPNDSQSNSVET